MIDNKRLPSGTETHPLSDTVSGYKVNFDSGFGYYCFYFKNED